MRSPQAKHTPRNRIGRRRGAALVLVIGVMFVLMALGTGSLYCGFLNRVLATRDGQQIMARAAADAGLKKAVAAMDSYTSGPLPSATDETLPGCMASYSFAIVEDADRIYSVIATGTSGTAVRTVRGRLKATSSSLWSTLAFIGDVSLQSRSEIRPAAGGALRLRTNSTAVDDIQLNSNSVIEGDVMVGPGGNPEEVIDDRGGRITGEKTAAEQALEFPPVVPPSGLPNYGNVEIHGAQVISNSRQYGNLTIQGGAVEIQGDITIYATGNVTIKSSPEFLVRDGSRLILYVGGTFSLKGGIMGEVNQRPERLQIYGTSTCTTIEVGSHATLYASIYAPAAAGTVDSSATLAGVYSGRSLALKGHSTLYYDGAANGQCRFGTNTYAIDRWWEN